MVTIEPGEMFSCTGTEYLAFLWLDRLCDAVYKNVVALTLFPVCLCYQTTEEDLNLDSEPTVQDTVEEVTIHVLLRSDYLGRTVGWREQWKFEMNSP